MCRGCAAARVSWCACAVCKELISRAKDKHVAVKGPVRLPTKTLRIHTRKTPNGEGSKTWHFYQASPPPAHSHRQSGRSPGPPQQMRIHKRLVDLKTSSEMLKNLINLNIEPGVDVDVTVCGE